MQNSSEINEEATPDAGAAPVTTVEVASDNDGNNNNNNKSVQDLQTARQTKLSSLKMLDFTEKSSMSSKKMQNAGASVDSTVVAEFQRLRRLRRRHSESNLLRNDSGLPGIASRVPHRHGLSSSLNSSGSTISMNSSPGASNSEGDTVLDLFLSPMSPKTSTVIDKNYSSTCSSPVGQRTPRPLSPVVTQRVTPLSPATTPRAASPLSPVNGPVSPRQSPGQSPLASPVSPITTLPKSPATSRRKPSPLTLEDTPRASSASQKNRPLAPVPLKPPESTSPRVNLPDSPRDLPDSPQGNITDQQQQDMPISPRNQRIRVNSGHSGSKHFEITLQDIAEHRERNCEDGRKKRMGQHPKKMLVRRNSEPPNGMQRRLRMAGLANEEVKKAPQVRITQELLTQKQGSDESICSSICEDEELKEKCLNWLQTIENP